jgi:hypothetical protein
MSPNSPQTKKWRQVRNNNKSMLIIFLTSQALSTRSSFPLVKPSMARFTVWVWSDWGRAFEDNFQTSWRTIIDFSKTIRLPLTHNSFFENSWLPKILQWFLTSPHSPDLAPCDFTHFPMWNYGWKDVVLSWLRRSTPNRKRLSTHTHLRNSRDKWNHGKNFGSLYTCSRGLLWRTRWKIGVLERYFLWSHYPKFWLAPRILSIFAANS